MNTYDEALHALRCAAGLQQSLADARPPGASSAGPEGGSLALIKWAADSGAFVQTRIKAGYAAVTQELESAIGASQRNVGSHVAMTAG